MAQFGLTHEKLVIHDFDPPNPRCCSSRQLCPDCMALLLRQLGPTANSSGCNDPEERFAPFPHPDQLPRTDQPESEQAGGIEPIDPGDDPEARFAPW